MSFGRGWAYVDAEYQGRKFRFVTTHLEVEDFADDPGGPGAGVPGRPGQDPAPVIATGDFNSAADPATTGTPTATYGLLTDRLRDTWRVNGDDPGARAARRAP